jgi:hypothetical protein
MTKTYARIDAGQVAELLQTEAHPSQLFHPTLRWVEAKGPGVAVGWIEGAEGLAPPKPAPAATPAPAPLPTLAELNARVIELAAEVAALTRR